MGFPCRSHGVACCDGLPALRGNAFQAKQVAFHPAAMVDDHRTAGKRQVPREHDFPALGGRDRLPHGCVIRQPGGLAAALAIHHVDRTVRAGHRRRAGTLERPRPQFLRITAGIQRPDRVAEFLCAAGLFVRLGRDVAVFRLADGQREFPRQAAAGQRHGMVAALGIVGHGDVPHIAAGRLAEPDRTQVGLQRRLAVQDAGQLQCHHAALGRPLGTEGDGGGQLHGIGRTVSIPSPRVAGRLVLLVPGGHFQFIVPVLGIGIGVARFCIGIPLRPVRRRDRDLGTGHPGGQRKLRHCVGKSTQLLHRQVGRALIGLADRIPQHRHDPVPAVGFQFGFPEGDGLLRKSILPCAAVQKGGRRPQQHSDHGNDHEHP